MALFKGLQELQLYEHLRPQIEFCTWSNSGNLSIKTNQKKFCDVNYAGTGKGSGLIFPSVPKLWEAYGLCCVLIGRPKTLKSDQMTRLQKKSRYY